MQYPCIAHSKSIEILRVNTLRVVLCLERQFIDENTETHKCPRTREQQLEL